LELKERFYSSKQEFVFLAILILSILPFLILHYFNQPTSEDFIYGEETRRIGFVKEYKVLYKYWGGRYFGYILMFINPLYLKSIAGYKVITFILMILFFYMQYLFINEFTKKNLRFRERVVFTLSVFFLYLYFMPSVGQGFYWWVSAIFYHVGLMLLMLFCIFYSRQSEDNNGKSKLLYTVLCAITIAAIAGSNELAAATILILMFILFIKSIFIDRKFRIADLFLAGVTLISVYYTYAAPGNIQRGKQYENSQNFMFSLESTFSFIFKELLTWTFFTPLLIITFILIPLLIKLASGSEETKSTYRINPLFSLVSLLIIIFLNVFLTFWSLGIPPYDRILNVSYFIFLMGWFYNVIVLMHYFKSKYEFDLQRLPGYSYTIALVLLVAFMFKENNIKTAYAEVVGGDAYHYNKELNDRYQFISESKSDTVVVDTISNVPKSFFLLDIFTDPELFYNKGYAMFFNKKAIIIRKNDD